MGGIVGDLTDAIGLTDHEGQREAARQAQIAANRSYGLTKEQLAFHKQQYEDWKDIYGNLQEQIAKYYEKLDGNTLAVRQNAQIDKQFNAAEKNLTQSLAQRGIQGSGIEAAGLTQLAQQEALAKANTTANAGAMSAQERSKFLALGLGQGTAMMGQMAGVSNNGASNMAGISRTQSSLYGQLSGQNTKAMAGIIGGAMRAGGYIK